MKAFCPICDREVETEVVYREEEYPVRETFVEVGAIIRVCKECGEDIWDDDFDNQNLIAAYNIYREDHKWLMPNEIKEIRERYGLSQVAFSRILGLWDKAIARYENGSLQDEEINDLIASMRNPKNYQALLETRLQRVTDYQEREITYA